MAVAALDPDLDYLADKDARTLGYAGFLPWVVVNAQPRPVQFGVIAEPWQREREARRTPALDFLAGYRDTYTGPRRFWSGCAKGNDKSTGVGRRIMFLLGYAKRPLQIYVASGSEDQAALITAAMKMELDINPWLAERVTVTDLGGTGKSGSELHVLPMKAATGQGIFPDYLIADELTHWQHEEGRKFWDFLVMSMRKRPACVVEVLTNAGFIGSWQWEVRKAVKDSPLWDFYEQPAHSRLATWISEESLDEDRRLVSRGEFDRLNGNKWIDPGEEDGYISLAEAEACVDPALAEQTHGKPGLMYYAVVDYGSGVKARNRDRTALTVLHPVPGSDEVVIDRLDCWLDPAGGRILIDTPAGDPFGQPSVEGWVELTRRNFHLQALILDPYQLEALAQKYERRGVRVIRFEYNAGKKNYRMAKLIQTMVQNRRLRWSADAGRLDAEDDTFAKELARLVKKPMSYGFRFDHEASGHDDRAAAVGMGLTTIVEEMVPGGPLGPRAPKKPEERPPGRALMPTLPVPVRRDYAANRGLFGMR